MSRSAYGRSPCWICGRTISNAGFAQFHHKMAHVRKGHYRHFEVTRHGRTRRGESYSYPAHEFEITKKGQRARKRRKDTEWREKHLVVYHTTQPQEEIVVHAVRWARRELKRLMTLDYTKWHGTKDADFTFCGRVIPLGLEGTFLPETDDDLSIIDCKHCMNRLREEKS